MVIVLVEGMSVSLRAVDNLGNGIKERKGVLEQKVVDQSCETVRHLSKALKVSLPFLEPLPRTFYCP